MIISQAIKIEIHVIIATLVYQKNSGKITVRDPISIQNHEILYPDFRVGAADQNPNATIKLSTFMIDRGGRSYTYPTHR